jgi:translation initiation factor IF-3
MLIGPDGKNLGVVPTPKAQELAKRCGLDLVEISPRARPPVCKIIDYGKYRYELAKKEKDSKKIVHKVKELKFRLTTDDHDYLVKMRHAEDFLMKGMKVKLMLVLRGREMMQKGLAGERIEQIKAELAHVAVADNDPKLVGRNYNLMLTPLPAGKRQRRFTVEEDAPADATAPDEGESEEQNSVPADTSTE